MRGEARVYWQRIQRPRDPDEKNRSYVPGQRHAGEGNSGGYTPGEKHPMLIFIAGYTDNCDWNAAEQVAAADYWTAIEFSRAGKITTQQIAGQDRMIRDSYASTIESGSSLVVYAAVDDQ